MVSQSIILNNKSVLTINEFLDLSLNIANSDIQEILNLDFQLDYTLLRGYLESERICPIVQLAKPEDAEEITQIFKEIYQGTYPFKKMENIDSVKEMIKDENNHWFMFRLNPNETVGCFGTHLEPTEKRGFLYGFVIRRKYHKIIDIFKAFIGCAIFLWKTYIDKILLWYGEMRTNEPTSQFFTSIIGLKPIAFLPNKDIFFNKVESDVLHVIYNKNILTEYRSKELPKIIRQVLNSYSYTNERYHLGLPKIENPNIVLNQKVIDAIKKRILKQSIKDKFENEYIIFSIEDSKSYFKFFHNPYSKNFEKTDYKVNKIEELYVFINELIKLIKNININYFECFVSAYEPTHQKLFLDSGFKPRGYVPCWKFEKEKNCFEDQILFNFYKGDITKEIKLIPESKKLIRNLQLNENKNLFDFLNV